MFEDKSQYITRAEFDAAIRALTVRGDDQTIAVDGSPGGQVIRSLAEVPTLSVPVSNEYISVSYDATTEKFTVKIAPEYIIFNGVRMSANYSSRLLFYYADAITYIFDKPTSGSDTVLFTLQKKLIPKAPNTRLKMYWHTFNGASSSDDDTNDLRLGANGQQPFAYVSLVNDGTYAVNYYTDTPTGSQYPNDPMETSYTNARIPYIEKIDGANTVRIVDAKNIIEDVSQTLSLDYTLPVNDELILGLNNTSLEVTLDLESNKSNYDVYQEIGRIIIDGDGVIETLYIHPQGELGLVSAFGSSDSVAIASEGEIVTLYIKNGQIVKVEEQSTTQGYSGTFFPNSNITVVNGRITSIA